LMQVFFETPTHKQVHLFIQFFDPLILNAAFSINNDSPL